MFSHKFQVSFLDLFNLFKVMCLHVYGLLFFFTYSWKHEGEAKETEFLFNRDLIWKYVYVYRTPSDGIYSVFCTGRGSVLYLQFSRMRKHRKIRNIFHLLYGNTICGIKP